LILSRELLMSLLYNAVLASFVVTFIHTSIQRYTTPVKASLIFTLEPVVASIVAFAWLGEKLGEREIAGAAIIFSGVLFSEVLGLSKKMRPREI
ncbi:MAG: EamA family transporter, partial [Chloroflexota bacterium]